MTTVIAGLQTISLMTKRTELIKDYQSFEGFTEYVARRLQVPPSKVS